MTTMRAGVAVGPRASRASDELSERRELLAALDVAETALAEALLEVDARRAAMTKVQALHAPARPGSGDSAFCAADWDKYPCATLRAVMTGPSW